VKLPKQTKRKKGETAREINDQEIDSKRQKVIKKGTEGRKSKKH
jgi:N-acetyltransferase 10